MVEFPIYSKVAQRFAATVRVNETDVLDLEVTEEVNRLPILRVRHGKHEIGELHARLYTSSLDHHDVGTGPFPLRKGKMTWADFRQALMTAPKPSGGRRRFPVIQMKLPLS